MRGLLRCISYYIYKNDYPIIYLLLIMVNQSVFFSMFSKNGFLIGDVKGHTEIISVKSKTWRSKICPLISYFLSTITVSLSVNTIFSTPVTTIVSPREGL